MALNARDRTQFTARSLFNANASFSFNEPLGENMTVIAFYFLYPLPVVAFRATLHDRLAVIFPGGMAIRALLSVTCNVSFMSELDIVESNGSLLYSDMAQRGAGHNRFEFLGLVLLIDDCQDLLRFTVRRIEKFQSIFDVMNALP